MLVMTKDLPAILRTNDIRNFHNGASALVRKENHDKALEVHA
jgi:hypothetical protein